MTDRPLSKKSWLLHYSELVRAWRRKSDTDDESLDAIQDAVLRLLENGVGKVANPTAYLKRSVLNRTIDRHRHQSAFPCTGMDDLADCEQPCVPGPEADVYIRQRLSELKLALEGLPLICRQVYIRHRLEGRTHAEIAAALNISTDMVEKYMSRTVRHLNKTLQNYV